jgi:hypothetical protein
MDMSVKQHLVTAEAFAEMSDPPDKRIDLVEGQVVEKPLRERKERCRARTCSSRSLTSSIKTIAAS